MSEDSGGMEPGYGPEGRDRRGQYRTDRTTDHSSPDREQPVTRNPEPTAERGLHERGEHARDMQQTARSREIEQRMAEQRRLHGGDQRHGQDGRADRLVADEQRTERPGGDTNQISHPSNPQRLAINGMVADQEQTINRQSNRLEERMATASAAPEKSNGQVAVENLNDLRGRNSGGMGSDTRVQKELQIRAETRGDLQGKIDAAQQRGRQDQREGRDHGGQSRQREQTARREREHRERGERNNTHARAR